MISDTSYLLVGRFILQANTTKDTVCHYDEMGLLKSRKRQSGSRLYNEFHPVYLQSNSFCSTWKPFTAHLIYHIFKNYKIIKSFFKNQYILIRHTEE